MIRAAKQSGVVLGKLRRSSGARGLTRMTTPPHPLISVVTAALLPDEAFLRDAYSSLCDQEAPWEWLLQIDGGEEDLPTMPDDERIHVEANGLHLGTAATRNRALARARGQFVFALDADDVLVPGALLALSEALVSDDRLALAFGRAADLLEDGRRVAGEQSPYFTPGVVEAGVIERLWHEHSSPPIAGPTVLWRTPVLAA